MGVVVLVFAGALFWLKQIDGREFQQVMSEQRKERIAAFDRFLAQRGESLAAFVKQQSSGDGIVEAIESGDWGKVEKTLTENVLISHGIHAFWVYDKDNKLLYARNQLYIDGLHEVPLPRSDFEKVLGVEHLAHFFANSPAGLLEIRGATIHPAEDSSGITAPRGYLFAARAWGAEELKEMSTKSGNKLALVDPKYGEPQIDPAKGEVVFSKLLPGWDGVPMMRLTAEHRSSALARFIQLSKRLLIWLVLFVATLLTLLAFALRRWVWRPLELFSVSLRTNNPEILRPLEKERGEIGELSRLIPALSRQRERLLEESRAARVTEKALEECVEQPMHGQSLDVIERLAGGVAHDFSNLLTVIIGYAGLLRDKLKAVNLPGDESEAILSAGQQAATLTRHLLAFSQKQVLHPRVVDLNQFVTEIEARVSQVVGEHVEVRVRTEARQGHIRADPTQLEQVILNLAANARDAMPRSGVLMITTGDTVIPEPTEAEDGVHLEAGRFVTLEVADTGTGMDAETEARMFEPFFSTKPPGQGIGLGLATVYGIVSQSGGSISVTTAEGKGTTFLLNFPMEIAEVDANPAATPIGNPQGNRETILVVEEEESVRALLCAVLRDRGYSVLAANGATTALTLAREHQGGIQLLVIDADLHQKLGMDLAQELRRTWPELKVLCIAGYTEEQRAVEGPLPLVGAIMEKPFTSEELAWRVRQVLDEERAQGPGAEIRSAPP